MLSLTYIYAHLEPDSDEIRYIGKSVDPWRRLLQHRRTAEKGKSWHTNWICALRARDLTPRMEIIAEVPTADWELWERHYIKYFRELGFRLTNITGGGDGPGPGEENHNFGKKTPLKVREKISNALIGRPLSSERCAAISAGKKGTPPSPQCIAAAVALRRGKPLSYATRAKISAARIGMARTPEMLFADAARSEKMSGVKQPGASSHFRGVTWYRPGSKWRASISLPGRRTVNLGYFQDEVTAATAVDKAVRAHGLPAARLNFP